MVDIPFALTVPDIPFALDGIFGPGQTIRVSWTGVQKNSPNCGPYGYALQISTDGGERGPVVHYSLDTQAASQDYAVTAPETSIHVIPFTDSHCSSGALLNCTVQVLGTSGFCVYGSRLQAGSALSVTLGQAGLLALLTLYGVAWWLPFTLQFAFTLFDLVELCGQGPGPTPALDANSQNWTSDQWFQAVKYVLWLVHCECVPGAPSPIIPAAPSSTQPPGWPTAPAVPCSNVDLCGAVIALSQQVAVMSGQLTNVDQLVTLIQRYGLPFAYVRGATHINLASSGSFAIARLLGMQVTITAAPDNERTLEGVPVYQWDLGWMSIMDGNGFIEEKRITRAVQVWLPPNMPEALSFGWFFKDGVAGTLTELEAEV